MSTDTLSSATVLLNNAAEGRLRVTQLIGVRREVCDIPKGGRLEHERPSLKLHRGLRFFPAGLVGFD